MPRRPKHRIAALAQRGAAARWAKHRAARAPKEPLDWSLLELADRAGFTGESWARWRVWLKASEGMPLTPEELEVWRHHTGRAQPPAGRSASHYLVVGRRGGKSSLTALRLVHAAACQRYQGRPGERLVAMCIAADRRQAGVILGYAKGILDTVPELKRLVVKRTREAVELATGVTLEVHTASFRTTRGYTIVAAACDEVAFWDVEGANPDREIIDNGLIPAMETIAEPTLLCISTPYSRRGVLWEAVSAWYGTEQPGVIVWRGTSREMNPTVKQTTVDRAYERDPSAAAAEWGGEFRSDVEGLVAPEVVQAVTVAGRYELPRQAGIGYVAFTDPAGGSGQDAMTLAIAHLAGKVAVLDCVRVRKPPFDPAAVARDFAELLKSYGLATVTGDAYGGEWPRQRFADCGIAYRLSERSRSELYLALIPQINARQVELLDLPLVRTQLLALERRTTPSGKDSVTHPPGALSHDDAINAAAGALVLAARGRAQPTPAAVAGAFAWNLAEMATPNRGSFGIAGAERHRGWEQTLGGGGEAGYDPTHPPSAWDSAT